MMNSKRDNRFVLVYRKTRLQELIGRFNTWPQARFYLEHNGMDAADYQAEHELYQQRLLMAEQLLRPLGRFQSLERGYLANYQFSDNDILVVIGQDGLVANTLKYLQGQPVIAINPDPARWDGKLLPFTITDLRAVVSDCVSGRAHYNAISLAQARTNDGQCMLAVNDLFIGPRSHTSARYLLNWGGKVEQQLSSGIIISTGFGSTGWFRSILAGALAVAGMSQHELSDGFGWDAQRLQFTVREPFPSKTTGTAYTFGAITPEQPLQLESFMPENGVIFSDGIEADYISFNSGTRVEVTLSQQQGCLVSG
jgi:NAD kinase